MHGISGFKSPPHCVGGGQAASPSSAKCQITSVVTGSGAYDVGMPGQCVPADVGVQVLDGVARWSDQCNSARVYAVNVTGKVPT